MSSALEGSTAIAVPISNASRRLTNASVNGLEAPQPRQALVAGVKCVCKHCLSSVYFGVGCIYFL